LESFTLSNVFAAIDKIQDSAESLGKIHPQDGPRNLAFEGDRRFIACGEGERFYTVLGG
jgi:hypothetical protein